MHTCGVAKGGASVKHTIVVWEEEQRGKRGRGHINQAYISGKKGSCISKRMKGNVKPHKVETSDNNGQPPAAKSKRTRILLCEVSMRTAAGTDALASDLSNRNHQAEASSLAFNSG
jgi:hypothetical protein